MWLTIYYIFCYLVFAYSMLLLTGYVWLAIMSRSAQKQLEVNLPDDETIKYLMQGSPLTPAVSIIAPAFNEEVTIIDSVNSLMGIDYPDYEIVIVNDESTDRTLEILINEYKLVEIPYDIALRVQSKPINVIRGWLLLIRFTVDVRPMAQMPESMYAATSTLYVLMWTAS